MDFPRRLVSCGVEAGSRCEGRGGPAGLSSERGCRWNPGVSGPLESAEGTSLVAQWLRIHLPMQGTRAQALVGEDPTCCGAAKPVHHNY